MGLSHISVLYAGVGLSGRRTCMEIVSRSLRCATAVEVVPDRDGGRQVTFSLKSSQLIIDVEAITGAAYREDIQREQRERATAIVVLVDSQGPRLPANLTFCEALLAAVGRERPLVMQFHKQDLTERILPKAELSNTLNLWGAPEFLSSKSSADSVLNPFVTAVLLAAAKYAAPLSLQELLGGSRER